MGEMIGTESIVVYVDGKGRRTRHRAWSAGAHAGLVGRDVIVTAIEVEHGAGEEWFGRLVADSGACVVLALEHGTPAARIRTFDQAHIADVRPSSWSEISDEPRYAFF